MQLKSIGIHQPNFMPWSGFFSKIKASDVFVFLDDVQYTKNSYINRVQLPISGIEKWITIPIEKSRLETKINEIKISKNTFMVKKLLKTIEQNYKKSPFFDEIFPIIINSLFFETDNLSNFNINFINLICKEANLKTELLVSSELNNQEYITEPTSRLISICKTTGTNIYHSGKGGFNYQDIEKFEQSGIKVKAIDFKPHSYMQVNSKFFIPGMSIIDALFSEGIKLTFEKL